jgi:phage gp45-like
VRLFHGEQQEQIEHLHQYGFSAVAAKPTGEGEQRKGAEAILGFMGSNRSHGVAFMVADRRFRLNNLKEGEVVHHDDQEQQVYLSRDVTVISSPKEIHLQRDDVHVQLHKDKVKIQKGEYSVTITKEKIFLGSEKRATHAVMTESGPSKVVFAVIDEKDDTMTAAPTAKHTEPKKKAEGTQAKTT